MLTRVLRACTRTRGPRLRDRARPGRGRAGAGGAAGGRDGARPRRLARRRRRGSALSRPRRVRHGGVSGRRRRAPVAIRARVCAVMEGNGAGAQSRFCLAAASAKQHTIRVVHGEATDSELILRIGMGDRSAFELLYQRYARPVFGLALRRLGDRGRAEDAVQETFASIWRAARSYKPDRGPGAPWLYAVARNAIVDRGRARCEHAGRDADRGARDRTRPARARRGRLGVVARPPRAGGAAGARANRAGAGLLERAVAE